MLACVFIKNLNSIQSKIEIVLLNYLIKVRNCFVELAIFFNNCVN